MRGPLTNRTRYPLPLAFRRRPAEHLRLGGRLLLLLLLLLLLGACSFAPFAGRSHTASLTSFDGVCFDTRVTTGTHQIPFLDAMSAAAMTRLAGAQGLELAGACDGDDLTLAYRMAFQARSLSWSAELVAANAAGQVVWRGREAAALPPDGAFQYLAESNAEKLLARFLEASADGGR